MKQHYLLVTLENKIQNHAFIDPIDLPSATSNLEVDDGLLGDGPDVGPLLLCVDLVDGVLDLRVGQQVARRVVLLQLKRSGEEMLRLVDVELQ